MHRVQQNRGSSPPRRSKHNLATGCVGARSAWAERILSGIGRPARGSHSLGHNRRRDMLDRRAVGVVKGAGRIPGCQAGWKQRYKHAPAMQFLEHLDVHRQVALGAGAAERRLHTKSSADINRTWLNGYDSLSTSRLERVVAAGAALILNEAGRHAVAGRAKTAARAAALRALPGVSKVGPRSAGLRTSASDAQHASGTGPASPSLTGLFRHVDSPDAKRAFDQLGKCFWYAGHRRLDDFSHLVVLGLALDLAVPSVAAPDNGAVWLGLVEASRMWALIVSMAHRPRDNGSHPLPMNGIRVAVIVRNWTLVSSGRDAM